MIDYEVKDGGVFLKKTKNQLIKLPKEFLDLWENEELILVGGAIRNYFEKIYPNDYDFFCPNYDSFKKAKFFLSSNNCIIEKENKYFSRYSCCDVKIDIFFHKNFLNIISILDSIDFTISKVVFYKKCFVMHKNFLKDLHDKKLSYCGSFDPRGSLSNHIYFLSKGYLIDRENLEKIFADIDKKESKKS